jgi:tetratricopeptide (TPR) repeat protein
MRKLQVLILALTFTISGFSQIDSLLNELTKHPQEDSVRYALLKKISITYRNVNPEKGVEAADAAIALAQKLNSPLKVAGSYINKANNLHILGRDSEAIALYRIAANINLSEHYQQGAANAYFNTAYIYFDLGNYFMAINYLNKALELYKALNLLSDQADVYNSIGNNYIRLDDYSAALKNFFNALNIYQQLNQKENEALVLSNMGMIYHALSDSAKALTYYQKALQLDKQADNKKNLAHDYQHIGVLYDDAGDFNKALEYYKISLSLNKELQAQREMAANMINIASAYAKLHNYNEANKNINAALEIYHVLKDDYNTAASLNEKGKIYADSKRQFALAIQLQQQALELSRKIKSPSLTVQILQDISNTYKKQGEYPKALTAYEQSVSLRDSISNDEQKKEITRLEMQSDFDKKEAAVKTLNDKKELLASQEISKQKLIKNISIITGAILLAAIIISFIFYKKRKDAVEAKKEADLKTQVVETEMKALRAQMNPHFIFNSLNSIGNYILSNDIKSANAYLTKFASVMRLILENSEHTTIALEEDLKALKLYMDVERLRLNNKFCYEINVDDNIDKTNVLVPPLILQPFVENSIWHGLTKKDGAGKINIYISEENKMLVCVVEDNGVGSNRSETFKEEVKQMGKKSLGMKITHARIDMINKLKNANASVNIFNKEEGVRAEIKLPVELKF